MKKRADSGKRIADRPATPAGSAPSSIRSPLSAFKVRAGQREFERGVDAHRVSGLVARRQYGKTTIASRIALKKMMRTPGHTIVFGSVKLDLGREIVRKEAEAMQKAFALLAAQAAQANSLLEVADTTRASQLSTRNSQLSPDDFADLYEHSRLEFRLWHDRTTYSRTKVVALTPAAVGETGDLILDEVGRVRNFREVWEAVSPIIASNPQFRCLLTTTPPPDDAHYSFELLAPPLGAELGINPQGNWYRSDLGVWVLRLSAEDAYADGVPLYDDDTGAPISPAESRQRASDKDAWDRNYACQFTIGGTAACGLLQLDTAQRRGVGQCALFQIQDDRDYDEALPWLAQHLGAGAVGLGFDVATTTKGTSNPSVLAVAEQAGQETILRAVLVWKTTDPRLATERLRRVVETVRARPEGGRARKLCVDATGERYFAQALRTALGSEIPVELVIASETVELPGMDEPLTMKQWLGGRLVAQLDDNHLTLPPERYLKVDWRLVRKEKGQLVCEPDVDGKHGDTFDGAKLALHALTSHHEARPIQVFERTRASRVLAGRRERSLVG